MVISWEETAAGGESAGREQAGLLHRAIQNAKLGLVDVWMRYFGIGGNAGEMEVEAFLHHALPLPTLERDMLAHAINELIDDRSVIYASVSSDLTEAHTTGRDRTTPDAGDSTGGR